MGAHKTAGKSLVIVLMIVATTSCQQSVAAWTFPSHLSNIAIITLDYQTLALKDVYVTNQTPCSSKTQAVSDEELTARASDLFRATQEYWEGQFNVSYAGDLAVLYDAPGDLGGVAVFHRCTGLALYARSLVWPGGGGEQLYPAQPIDSKSLQHTRSQVSPPQKVDVMIGSEADSDREKGLSAWNAMADLNVVKELASSPYSVLVYSVRGDPNRSEWIIFVHRSPEEVQYTGPTITPSPSPTAQPLLSPLSTPRP